MRSTFWLMLLLLAILINNRATASHPDEVTDLPGLPHPCTFRHYSGYLNATKGKKLHYWFVESEGSPETDPLVLWMNGGPGCSSLAGFLTEQGPFHVKKDGMRLYFNENAWNKVANVMFLEAPAGVGFSYDENGGDYATDDDQVALDNYVALKNFYLKFPQFKENQLYITGESYGGIYVPTLSVNVLRGTPDINFKGFAIGNGYLDRQKLGNAIVFFGYYHGLYGKTLWSSLVKYCCKGSEGPENCEFVKTSSPECQATMANVSHIIQSTGLNVYNLYQDCDESQKTRLHQKQSREYFDRKLIHNSIHWKNQTRSETEADLLEALGDNPPCIDDSNVGKWVNQAAVREALHIPSQVQEWEMCSSRVEAGYKTLYDTMKPQLLELLGSGRLRGMVYNGDVDMACNFLGDQWFVDDLGLQLLDDYQEWHFKGQVAGFVKHFENLVLATIKGSGHMVPEDKPGAALKLITSFIRNGSRHV